MVVVVCVHPVSVCVCVPISVHMCARISTLTLQLEGLKIQIEQTLCSFQKLPSTVLPPNSMGI